MSFNQVHFRHSLLFLYQKGFKAADAHRELLPVFGEETPSDRQCRNWYQRFESKNYSLEDEPCTGRPPSLENSVLLAAVRDNPRSSTRELGELLGYSHQTVARHLTELGFTKKLGRWIPHSLREDQLEQRVTICNSLLSRNRRNEWLMDIITGDEKWVMYFNENRRGQWVLQDETPEPDPKPDRHGKKVMLTVFWDYKGIISMELLQPNTTINSEKYCYQLDRLHNILPIERPHKNNIFLLHDNARPHTAKKTRQKIINEFGWEILPHPPYSPDLAPTDYYLFRHLSNHIRGKTYNSFEDLNFDIRSFFNSKSEEFFRKGIMELPERWAQVVDNDGAYCL